MPDEPFEEDYEREPKGPPRTFDARVLAEPVTVLPTRKPLVFSALHTVAEAMEMMQQERRGAVLVTEDGTPATPLIGMFTDRDVLLRVVGRGRNPASLPLRDVMTRDVECLGQDGTIAWALNYMALSGYRHIPVVNEQRRPLFVVSVRDVIQLLVDFFPREVLTLPPRYGEGGFRQREGA